LAKDRKVIYTLAVETDPSVKKAFDDLTAGFKAAEAASKSAGKAAKEAASEAKSAVTRGGGKGGFSAGYDKAARDESRRMIAEEKREREQRLREMAADVQREKRILADRVRANVEASRAQRDAARETKAGYYRARAAAAGPARSGGVSTDDEMRLHVESLGRQYAEAERLDRRRVAASSKAWKDTGQAVNAATHAVVSYGRAMVLLSAADEESAQRMLQKIAKFEAFASVLTGTISVVKAGTSAWRAYQAAAAAAALASGAAAARGGRGGAVGGMLSSGLSMLGRGAAAAAPIAGMAGIATIGLGVAGMGAVALKALAQGKSVKDALIKAGGDLYDGVLEFTGFGDMAGSAAKKAKKAALKARQDMEDASRDFIVRQSGYGEYGAIQRERSLGESAATPRSAADIRGSLRRQMLGGSGRDFARDSRQASAASAFTSDELSFADMQKRNLSSSYNADARLEVEKRIEQLHRQQIDDAKELARIEMESKREKIDGERAAHAMLRSRAQDARRMLQDEQNAKKSAAVRFGTMSESEQQRTLQAIRKLKAGGEVNRQDEEFARSVGGAAATYADESAIRRAKKAGFDEIDQFAYAPRILGAQARVNNLNLQVDAKQEIVVKLEADYDKQLKAVTDKLGPLFESVQQTILNGVELKLAQLRTEIALRDAQDGSR